jgi:murein tripeptide amidase MpaA
LGDSAKAKYLLKNFVFKIIPMLNPDGVIVGNYRCNLNGYDLNRHWNFREPIRKAVPEIEAAVNMIENVLKTRKIAFFCDIHGHKYDISNES